MSTSDRMSTVQVTPASPQEEADQLLLQHQARRAERETRPAFIISCAATAPSETYIQLGDAGRGILRQFLTNMLARPDVIPPAELQAFAERHDLTPFPTTSQEAA